MPIVQKESPDCLPVPLLKPVVQVAQDAGFGTGGCCEGGVAERGCRCCGCTGLVAFAVVLSSLSLFVLHQMTMWLSLDPDAAFRNVKLGLYACESIYDTTGNLWNAMVEVMLVAIPGWNAAVVYVIEPLAFTALDVLSIAFAKVPYTGVITEADVKYEGFYCPPDGDTSSAAEWCGMLAFYEEQLGVAAGSPSSFIGNSTVVLSTQTARRLAEATGEPVVGALDLGALAAAIQALLGSGIVVTGTSSDIIFHVIWVVLSETFELLVDLFMKLIRALSSAFLSAFRSGAFSSILKFGIDLMLVLILDIGIPLLFAMLDAVFCIVDMTQPAGWASQLSCIEKVCFQEGSDVPGEVYHTFLSIDPIARAVSNGVDRLFNPQTGQRYDGSVSGGVELPNLVPGSAATPRATLCAACFTCQVAELRAIFLLVGTIWGCALDGERYPGRVEGACLEGGTGYADICGPRVPTTDLLMAAAWRNSYTEHRKLRPEMAQSYAARFEQLAIEQGGEGSLGNPAARIARAWFERDVSLGEDQSAHFTRAVCREMRRETADTGLDGGPNHADFTPGSMRELTMGFAYEMCKAVKGLDTCKVNTGQWAVDTAYEIQTCMKSQPKCLRGRDVCLGSCFGAGGGALKQDFVTTFAKQEVSVAAVGSDALRHGRANCTPATRVIEVPLFATGEAFKLYSARLRVRGGFNAIDARACKREPAACAAIQKARLVHR